MKNHVFLINLKSQREISLLNMKNKPNYGFPLSDILFRLLFFLVIVLILFLFIMLDITYYIVLLISICILPIYLFFGIIQFKNNFIKNRTKLLEQIIKLADIKEDELVLDLGTGSGFLTIGFAKQLETGNSVGLDKYSLKSEKLKIKIITYIKTNFIQNTLKNAKANAKIENVENKCRFIQTDITNPFNFEDEYFDIIVSSQLFYCISSNKRSAVFQEVDRVLKKSGKIIFFESKSFMDWDINEAKNFFENKAYKIELIQSNEFKTCSILFGKK